MNCHGRAVHHSLVYINSLHLQGTVPREEFAGHGDVHQESELVVIARGHAPDLKIFLRAQNVQDFADVGLEKIFSHRVNRPRPFAKIMPRGKFMAAPRGKPVGPAQIKHAAWIEELI